MRKLKSPLLFASSTCSGGTCDGCNFHFLWESAAACPLCSAADYHAITSSCVAGVQVGFSAWRRPRGEGSVRCEFLDFSPTEDYLCVERTEVLHERHFPARTESHHLQNDRFLAESGHLCGHLHSHSAHRLDLLLLEKESKVHDDRVLEFGGGQDWITGPGGHLRA